MNFDVLLVNYARILKAACRSDFSSLPAHNKCDSMAIHQYDTLFSVQKLSSNFKIAFEVNDDKKRKRER